MKQRFPLVIACLCATLSIPSTAFAWLHMAKAGETLEQLSVRYYGTPDKAAVIRAANGFVHPDTGRLTEGESVEIPEILHVRVGESETWASLSASFLSSQIHAAFLADLNGFKEDQAPPAGTIIRIPFHLRHIFATDETVKSVAELYYKDTKSADWLIRYNTDSKKKYGRGDVIIVPLWDLAFTEEEQARVDAFRDARYTRLDEQHQEAAREVIASLKSDFDTGRYVEMVAKASGLLGYGHLTVPQEIGVQNYLAYAYVALDAPELAKEAFKQALALQPDMELSAITSSPKILKVFKKAKRESAAAGP